ncbi:hypothetical protein ACIO52_02470 [Nocardia sp. NPDC087230]|uniref:hypothetical protein n=1 Tax=Nocardia sp. NPDC087230 TaxID=3364331 RepID=UPI003801627F
MEGHLCQLLSPLRPQVLLLGEPDELYVSDQLLVAERVPLANDPESVVKQVPLNLVERWPLGRPRQRDRLGEFAFHRIKDFDIRSACVVTHGESVACTGHRKRGIIDLRGQEVVVHRADPVVEWPFSEQYNLAR